MNSMHEDLRQVLRDPATWVMIAILVIMFIVVIVLVRMRRRREFIYEVSARDQRMVGLDERVANPEYTARSGPGTAKRYPYETSYFSAALGQRKLSAFFVGILVETEMVQQRFYTDVSTPIEVGRDASCAITVSDERMAPRQFVLEVSDGRLEVRNLAPDHAMILERGDMYHKVAGNATVLVDGDTIRTGKSKISISFGE